MFMMMMNGRMAKGRHGRNVTSIVTCMDQWEWCASVVGWNWWPTTLVRI